MKTLMVLGAGPNQVPLVRRAVDAGHHVVTVDYLPDNVAHQFAHQSIDCSTVDRDGVLAAAEKLEIDGIATAASDVATPTVGYVAERMGLPGPGSEAAATMANKALFRAFQGSHDLRAPGFVVGASLDAVEERLSELDTSLIFKPVDTSGSRGVTQVDGRGAAEISAAFAEAARFSRSGLVCVEEFVAGHDVSGDGFFSEGKLAAAITHKFKSGFVPLGHRLPTHLAAEEQYLVLEEVERVAEALGYADGPIDFDVRISDSGATVLEMSPRLGGNAIPALIRHATGVDLVGATIEFALGGSPDLPAEFEVTTPAASLVLGSPEGGVVTEVSSTASLRDAVPEILECGVEVVEGDSVGPFVHSANGIGYAVFRCPTEDQFEVTGDRIRAALDIRVESKDD